MKVSLYLLAVFLGVILTVHLAMNGKVGAVLENPRVANGLFWCIGAVAAILIGVSGWQPGALDKVTHVNPVLLLAGAMGASLVFGIAWLIPQIGAGPLTLCLLLGQIASGVLISHYGLLGSPVQTATVVNLAGVALMGLGVALATVK